MQLKVSSEDRSDGVTVVRVESEGGEGGALDLHSAPELRSLLLRFAEEGRLIMVVDLSAMDDIDGHGIGVLVGVLKRVHLRGGAISLVVSDGRIRDVLSRTGLTKFFRTHGDVSSAMAKLAADAEQRRAAHADRAARRQHPLEQGVIVAGWYTYEHISDHITLVSVPDAESEAQISVYTAPALRTVLVDLMNQGRYFLVVDLTFVALLDSTGLGVLVGCLKRLRAYDGAIVLVAPTVRMQKLLRVVGFQYLFSQFDTVDAAVEFLGRRVPQAYA